MHRVKNESIKLNSELKSIVKNFEIKHNCIVVFDNGLDGGLGWKATILAGTKEWID